MKSGDSARLDCAAKGEPTPQIAWQKDGGNMFPAAMERRMHVMPSDDAFFIINANIQDQGVYTCTAENTAGIIKANATLIINGRLNSKENFFKIKYGCFFQSFHHLLDQWKIKKY